MLQDFPGELLAFTEYLGLAEHPAQESGPAEPGIDAALCSGHAPYSTHPRLLQRLKERAVALDHVFPVHVAEPVAEGEMIRQGRGEIVDFIRQRGFWDGSFTPTGQGGSIQYLYDLDVLDHRTLCIHAIHVLSEEIRIMAGEGVKVCLCPGSNRFLNTGTAPVREYLDHGILPAAGADAWPAIPSFPFGEMRILAEQHPTVEAEEIFRMATGVERKRSVWGIASALWSPARPGICLPYPFPKHLATVPGSTVFWFVPAVPSNRFAFHSER